FQPNDWNAKLDSAEVMAGIAYATRKFGRLPTRDELSLARRTDPAIPSAQVITRHFGRRDKVISALRKRASQDATYADIVEMLPAESAEPFRKSPVSKLPDGFVYLIKSGDFFKIGRSDDAERRFKQITVALPDKAELFHTIRTDDPAGIEAYWHKRFAQRRANGEWFKLSVLDVAAFKKRKFQ
ncbi:MAG: GIY-YIG nuclease family protein, partial [Parvibaculum sp.]